VREGDGKNGSLRSEQTPVPEERGKSPDPHRTVGGGGETTETASGGPDGYEIASRCKSPSVRGNG